ncbi:MAG: hypothetical protein HQL17_08015 [Candidatus Omnitrophica bacterium]|nr:hypothetical protein [Candidatus Omnitrophota bacterium]
MLMIAFLVGIFLAACGVIGWLWFEFQKEEAVARDRAVVAVTDVNAVESAARMDEQQDQIRRLKEQIQTFQDNDKTNEETILHLRVQADELKVKLQALEAFSAPQSDEKLAHLRAENVAFRAQLDEAVCQLKDLHEGAAHLESDRTQMQAEFEGVIEQLRAENLQLKAHTATDESDLHGFKDRIDELSSKVSELEMTKAIQQEKNEYLQYELTKSRAQVVGLERLSRFETVGNAS